MRHLTLRTFALVLVFGAAPISLWAQGTPPPTPRTVMELVLNDDTTLFGYVQGEESTRVVFETVAGDVREISRRDIASLLPILGSVSDGAFWRVDPFESRTFFSATGRALRRNHGYAGTFGVAIVPFFQVGLTDRVSVGAGATPFLSPVLLSVKAQVFRGRYNNAAVGIFHAESTYTAGRSGVAYVVDTIGTPDLGVTIGVGRRYQDDRGSLTPFGAGDGSNILLLGVDYRVGPKLKLITEHYFNQGGGSHIFGIRIISDVVGVDLGVARFDSKTDFGFAPIVNVCWKIGR